MTKITDYKRLEVDKVYRFFNSMNESFLYHYRGYHYEEEYRGDVLIFWNPGTNDMGAEWSVDEFKHAIEDGDAQCNYHMLVESVTSGMNAEGESFIVALVNYERSSGSSVVTTLHEAGISMQTFREEITSRICMLGSSHDL